MSTPTDLVTVDQCRDALVVIARLSGWRAARLERAAGSGACPPPPTFLLSRGGFDDATPELLVVEVSSTDAYRKALRSEAADWFAWAQALGGEGLRVCPSTIDEALDRVRQEPKA